jgi:hypothetical protein
MGLGLASHSAGRIPVDSGVVHEVCPHKGACVEVFSEEGSTRADAVFSIAVGRVMAPAGSLPSFISIPVLASGSAALPLPHTR